MGKIYRIGWRQLKKEMSIDNAHLSPYMTYEFMKIFKHTYRLGNRVRRTKKIVIYKCELNSGEIVICPMLLGETECYVLGDLCATGYLDFIYSMNLSEEDFDETFDLLRKVLGKRTLVLNKINQSSLLGKYLANNYPVEVGKCVNISLPKSIDEYYSSLSKHVRQNIRTAKNRLERENIKWSIEVINGKKLKQKDYSRLMDVYIKREEERNQSSVGKVVAFIQKNMNPITIYLKRGKNNFTAILRFDGEVVAFLSGILTSNGKTLVIPRLAINSDFSVYSPGILLIFETISYCIEEIKIINFDLSRGEEKYKYSMGGKEHLNYSIRID